MRERGPRETICLIDSSSIAYGGDSLLKNLYEAVDDPKLIDRRVLYGNLRHTAALMKFGESFKLMTTAEVITEREEYLRIMSEQYKLIKRKLSKSDLPREESEELLERLGLVSLCRDSAVDFADTLQNKTIYPELLHGAELALGRWGYKKAKFGYERGAPTEPEECRPKKFGDLLETDIKLIGMAMALSLNNPVILVTRDLKMKDTLRKVDSIAGPLWQGVERYEVSHVNDVYDVTEQALNRPKFIRIREDVPNQNPESQELLSAEQTHN